MAIGGGADPPKFTDPIKDSPPLQSQSQSQSQLPSLPEGIIVDIIAKLPVKSLLKFRCVCKSWRSLISDPYFVKKHFHMANTDTDYHNHRVMLLRNIPVFDLKSYSLYSLFNDGITDSHIYNGRFDKNSCRYEYCIVGSCNGLLCIVVVNHDIACLWNPSTRETRWLPQFGFTLERWVSSVVYGFGYDSSSDDYKLMATYYRGGSYNAGVAKVYTLSSNSWRRIEKSPVELPGKPGLFVGGALIWSAVDFGDFPGSSSVYWKIVAFDLVSETYQEVPQPMREVGAYDKTLGVLGGCLCLLANYREAYADLWVMKDYGVKESWTKFFTIPCFINLWVLEILLSFTPVWFSSKGELLAKINRIFGVFDAKECIRSTWINYFHSLQSRVYIESLVSPNPTLRMPGNTNSGKKRKQTSGVRRVDQAVI